MNVHAQCATSAGRTGECLPVPGFRRRHRFVDDFGICGRPEIAECFHGVAFGGSREATYFMAPRGAASS
jgi:hypothetical protein